MSRGPALSTRSLGATAGAVGRKAAAVALATATMLLGLVFMANPAGAHHTEGQIDTVACLGPNDVLKPSGNTDHAVKVNYTAMPWYSNSDGNPQTAFAHDDITIEAAVNGASLSGVTSYFVNEASITPQDAGDETPYRNGVGAFVPTQDHLVYPLIADRNPDLRHSQTGYFVLESDTPITSVRARLKANGPWRSGGSAGAATQTVTIPFDSGACDPISDPAATVTWECGSAVGVELDNRSSLLAVTFDVNGTEHEVAAGATEDVDLGVPAEGSSIDVTVTAPGMDEVSYVVDEVDCEQPANPAASVAWECGSSVVVSLTNAGGESPAVFFVNGEEHEVAIDGSKDVDLGVPGEGSSIDVTVTAEGMDAVTDVVGEVDCENPAASVAWECGSSVVVTLTNAGGALPVTFEVNGAPYEVAGDGSLDVDLGIPAEGDPIDVTVTAPSMDDVTFAEAQVDCEGVLCDDTETGVDGDGDEDADTCEPVVCDEGETPVAGEDDTNDVADTCETPDPEVLLSTVTPTPAQPAPVVQSGALAFTGVSSMTLAVGAAMLLLVGIGLTLVGKEFAEG